MKRHRDNNSSGTALGDLGALPPSIQSRNWIYIPSSVLGFIVLILVILLMMRGV